MPTILWLANAFPFDRQTWKRAVPVHVFGVFVATLFHVLLAVASRMVIVLVRRRDAGLWQFEAQRMFFLNFDWEMMTYWTIVGISHALRYHREARRASSVPRNSRLG